MKVQSKNDVVLNPCDCAYIVRAEEGVVASHEVYIPKFGEDNDPVPEYILYTVAVAALSNDPEFVESAIKTFCERQKL